MGSKAQTSRLSEDRTEPEESRVQMQVPSEGEDQRILNT